MYRDDSKLKNQSQSFSGVGVKHQNAMTKCAIQTIVYMATTFMVHVSVHWSEQGVNDLALWGFAVYHAAWIHDCIPNQSSGLTPLELLIKGKTDHQNLHCSHVWGCRVFVLDPKLHKWNSRSQLGLFLGFSGEHPSLVAVVCNLSLDFVPCRYHVVFDDLFQTVFSS